MEMFQWAGHVSWDRVPTAEAVCGFSVRRWRNARRQACSSVSSLVGASAETRSWMPFGSWVKWNGKGLAEPDPSLRMPEAATPEGLTASMPARIKGLSLVVVLCSVH